jgi:hypothetical protein
MQRLVNFTNDTFDHEKREHFFQEEKNAFFAKWNDAVWGKKAFFSAAAYIDAGLPDFSWYNLPKREKITNEHKTYQMATKYTKWK